MMSGNLQPRKMHGSLLEANSNNIKLDRPPDSRKEKMSARVNRTDEE